MLLFGDLKSDECLYRPWFNLLPDLERVVRSADCLDEPYIFREDLF